MQTKEITNCEDIIDSRDVIARINDLSIEDIADSLCDDEVNELSILRSLQEDTEGCAEDWEYGITLIRDSYFEAYAQELAEEIDAIPDNLSWPCSCIDWEQAARELQMDYTAVDFDGVTYWVR